MCYPVTGLLGRNPRGVRTDCRGEIGRVFRDGGGGTSGQAPITKKGKEMRVSRFFALAAVAMLCWVGNARAAVIFSDNFDGYADQPAFDAVWTAQNTVGNGILSNAQSVSAPNSVSIPTNAAVATRRAGLSHAESGTVSAPGPGQTKLVYSFDFFDSAGTASPYRQFAALQDSTAPTLTNQLISMGLNNNLATTHDGGNYYMARILGFTPTFLPPTGTSANPASSSGAYFKLNDVAAPLRSTGWHNLKVEISTSNGTSQDYNFFVDGVLSKTISGIGTVLRSYDTQRIGSGVSSTNSAFYDNYSFELVAIPEPVTLGAVGMGMLLLVRRRR